MAHLTDEYGNPIQLTDERGNPVTLTDERGRPMHLSGVAYSPQNHPPPAAFRPPTTTVGDVISGAEPGGVGGGHGQYQPRRPEAKGTAAGEIQRSSSSSSGTSGEDEGEVVEGGTRRKKKGITQKIKEKLAMGGGSKKDDVDVAAHQPTLGVAGVPATMGVTGLGYPVTTGGAMPHKVVSTDTTTQKVTTEHVEKEKGGAFVATDTTTSSITREHRDNAAAKKGFVEKIMEKLPGHH